MPESCFRAVPSHGARRFRPPAARHRGGGDGGGGGGGVVVVRSTLWVSGSFLALELDNKLIAVPPVQCLQALPTL